MTLSTFNWRGGLLYIDSMHFAPHLSPILLQSCSSRKNLNPCQDVIIIGSLLFLPSHHAESMSGGLLPPRDATQLEVTFAEAASD